ncbi:MAG: hypothetical protein WAV50_01360 [Minisyncoccia bacterium]
MNKTTISIIAVIAVIVAGWFWYSSQSKEPVVDTTPVSLYETKTDTTKGTYMSNAAGMTVYTFDNDQPGVSNCSGTCATNWPPYISSSAAGTQLPADISVITRADGSSQYAWQGKPLYYYIRDVQAGDINGDGVGGVWHIVKL